MVDSTSPQSESPTLTRLRRWALADWRAHNKWRKEARENFAFIAGDQWSAEEKQAMEGQNRPAIVFNRAATIINAISGSEINNRTEVRFYPRTLGDAQMNEVLTKAAEWFRDRGGAEEEDSQAFHDTLTCGIGWVETLLDFEEDTDGEPAMDRINPLEMCWDGSARKRGLTDARRFARVRKVPVMEAREMFPDASISDLDAGAWFDAELEAEKDRPTRQWSDDDYNHPDDPEAPEIEDRTDKDVLLVQMQWCERRKYVEYVDPQSGQKAVMSKRKFQRFMDRTRKMVEAAGMGYEPQITYREITRKEWRQVFLGNRILGENQPCKVRPTFTPICGYWDNAQSQWFGLLHLMKDPQKWANKWLTQTLHIINANAKGGVMVEEDAVDKHDDFEDAWAATDAVQWLRPGGLQKVQEKQGVQFPQAVMNLMEFAISSIRDVAGVNLEILGQRDSNQPGVLEYQRKQAAMTTLAMVFDALRQYRKQQGHILLYYIQEYLADGRLVRISTPEGARYEPLQMPEDAIRFDVIVDDAPSSPNNKERVWEVIMHLMPVLEKAGLPPELWAEIVEYSPFPQALVQKMRDFALKPDPERQKQEAMQQAMIEAELAKTQAEAEGEQAGALKDRANAIENLAQAMKAYADAQNKPQDNMLEQIEEARMLAETMARQDSNVMERNRMGLDAITADQEADAKMAKARADLIKAQAALEAARNKPKGSDNG